MATRDDSADIEALNIGDASSIPNKEVKKPPFTPPTPGEVPTDPLHDVIVGYPKLAGRMGVMPEMAMFKRFGSLNARNLLYMQNELMYLEMQLKYIEAKDQASDDGNKGLYGYNFFWMKHSESDEKGNEQIKLVMRMRKLLKEYILPQFKLSSSARRLTEDHKK
ncbi:uncharacterized protein J4E92_003186 [Alternaria infectoria]|uniref:uncharacterized protein n=1 Tax=Alternaria infectoria TaxID=45303 RepID=UPI0022205485|nr:uncharacterized protein J4E92_003186 [Alternaria infectoria]KAI4933519.1 hypothetical protein J4E92_003186 [Alternaria infectoria]